MTRYLTADTVITGTGDVVTDGAVRISGSTIDEVGSAESISADGADVEHHLGDATLLPGLIDGHVHLGTTGDSDVVRDTLQSSPAQRAVRALKHAETTLEAGITTVRDLASLNDVAVVLRDEIAAGSFDGPRILASGNGLLPTGGHGIKTPWYWPDEINELGRWRIADGPSEIRAAVREQLEIRADVIKVWATGGILDPEGDIDIKDYSQEELEVLVEEATRHNTPVAAHAHPAEAIKSCLSAGVRTIEHGTYIDDEAIGMMEDKRVYMTATRAVLERILELDGVPDYYATNADAALSHQAEKLEPIYEAGLLGMGTDTGVAGMKHGENATELVSLVDAGLDPHDAVRSATAHSAEMLELDDTVGTLEAGKKADVIAVRGDLLSEIERIESDVGLVIRDGDVITNEFND